MEEGAGIAGVLQRSQSSYQINKLFEEAGWHFFDSPSGKANIVLEPNVKLTSAKVDALGDNFETTSNGFIDFLLLDKNGSPLIVLEAKSEDKNPLVGKEQARKYAKSQNCRFVIQYEITRLKQAIANEEKKIQASLARVWGEEA